MNEDIEMEESKAHVVSEYSEPAFFPAGKVPQMEGLFKSSPHLTHMSHKGIRSKHKRDKKAREKLLQPTVIEADTQQPSHISETVVDKPEIDSFNGVVEDVILHLTKFSQANVKRKNTCTNSTRILQAVVRHRYRRSQARIPEQRK